MPPKIEQAAPSDAAAIAKIFLSNETDEFLRLQFGTVEPGIMNSGLIDRLTENIKTSGQVYVIARDEETGEIVSYASWTLPRAEDEPYVQQRAEVSMPVPIPIDVGLDVDEEVGESRSDRSIPCETHRRHERTAGHGLPGANYGFARSRTGRAEILQYV